MTPNSQHRLIVGDKIDPVWLRYLQSLEGASAADIRAIATALGSPDGTVANIPPQSEADIRLLQGAGIAITGNAENGYAIAIRPLRDSGTGALLGITRDAYGRVSGTTDATITGTAGQIVVANGDAVAGPPTLSLADVADAGGGTLQKTAFDAKGRKTGSSAATTSDLAEGTNLYYTDARVYAATKAQLVAGTNVSIVTDDGAQLLIISASGGDSASGGEALVQDGASAPPVMLTNEAEDDFVFSG